ncbi:hypothetical protein VB734_13215 [Synechococcus sp. BA-124 BA4]|nr:MULTISPECIES: hypothetical protein [unclassified Synechococcus]MEA5401000.1 hypothetical protein [Synechococcus sp. BA-124 BA4]CAK6696422.1 hypothetical protein BBFGKLBO_02047 [Synechococcus sp. CBW1107]
MIDELITLAKQLDALANNNSNTEDSARMSVMVKRIFNSSGYT